MGPETATAGRAGSHRNWSLEPKKGEVVLSWGLEVRNGASRSCSSARGQRVTPAEAPSFSWYLLSTHYVRAQH